MNPGHVSPHGVKWDAHIQLVFSVLVGVSFSQLLSSAGEPDIPMAVAILSAGMFLIVLDNWYQLFVELGALDIRSPVEVYLYALAVVPYSGMPFIIGVRSHLPAGWGPARWMAANLVLICIFDVMRMLASLWAYERSGVGPVEGDAIIGRFGWFIPSGIFYAIILCFVAASIKSQERLLPCFAILGVWLAIRIIDTIVLRRWIDLFTHLGRKVM